MESNQDISRATAHEINLLYIVARCADTMLADIETRLASEGKSFSRDPKRRLKEFTHMVEQAGAHFRNFIEPNIIECVEGDYGIYELTRQHANELIRLLMLYYEVCTKGNEASHRVFDLLCEMKGNRLGVFSVEDINRFDLGCR